MRTVLAEPDRSEDRAVLPDGVEIPRVVLRSELLAAGWSPDEVRRLRQRGELRPLGRGVYLPADREPVRDGPARRRAEHAARVRAVLRRFGPDVVASHVSAAVLHGLPTWGLPLDRVHLTRDRSSGARRTAEVQIHAASLPGRDVRSLSWSEPGPGTAAVTSPARTVVDIARTHGFEQAVVVADAALARLDRDTPPPATPEELDAAVAEASRRPGAAAARRVVAFADGRSGSSPGESRSRVVMAAAALPAPELQWEIRGPSGMHIATVDFAWPARRVVGEFDGRAKYGRLLRPGEDPGDAVYREKRREDAVRSEGWTVVRWVWADLRPFTPVLARLGPLLWS